MKKRSIQIVIHSNFEYITTLQYQNQVLKRKIHSFESREMYVQLQANVQKQLRKKERAICDLKTELEQAIKRFFW